ncbi:MAG TPA: aldo/keto reductase [Tepidisphaeraceae bacterium]|jgi:diketogulonate reductase-like aldo/keto reductase
MEHHRFGPTRCDVPVIGMGTWYIEREDRDAVIAAIRVGMDLGMTHIDTAEMYGSGAAEQIVGAAIVGFVAFSVVGAYIYFPERSFCLERMRYLSADTRDLLLHGQAEPAIRYLEEWDLVARQLQVGVYIRDFGVTPEQAKTVDDLREAIEAVRDDVRANKLVEAKRKLDQVVFYGEYKACRDCYGPGPGHG